MNRKLLLLVLTIASVAYGQPAGPVLAPIPNDTILGNSFGSTAAPSAQSSPVVSGSMTANSFLTAGVCGTYSLNFTNFLIDCSGNVTANTLAAIGNLNVTPTSSVPVPGQEAISWTGTLTGSSSTAADYAPANIYVASDTFSNTSSAGRVDGLLVYHNFGGGSSFGNFTGISSWLYQSGATTNTSGSYVGVSSYVRGNYNDGGTSFPSNTQGGLFGANPNVGLQCPSGVPGTAPCATYWFGIYGQETDIFVSTGASVGTKIGMLVREPSTDAVQGNNVDAAFAVVKQHSSTGPGFQRGLLFGEYDGDQGMSTTATLIGCQAHASLTYDTGCGTIATGLNLSGFTISNYSIIVPGLNVNGSGLLTGTAGLTITGAAVALNASSNFNTSANTGTSTGTFTAGNMNAPGPVIIAGPTSFTYGTGYSGATWTNASPVWNINGATLNDTTTGSGGVTTESAYSITAPTITNIQGTANVLTNLNTVYVAAPNCGSGWASCTNPWSIYAAGNIRALSITATSGASLAGAAVTINNNSNFTTTINGGTSSGTLNLANGSGNNTVNIGNGTGLVTFPSPVTMSNATVKLSGLTTSSAGQTGTVCSGTGGLLTVDTTTTCLLSDGRYKMNVEPLNVGLAEVMQFKPVSYDLRPDANPTNLGRQVGLIAQDVIKIDPRFASVYQSGPDEGTPSGVRYEQMVALLIKGMQEQQAEIISLRGGS